MNKNIILPARFLRRNTFILWCINIRSNKKLFASLQNSYVNQYIISKPIPVQVYAKTVWWYSSKSRQRLSSCLPSVSRAKGLKTTFYWQIAVTWCHENAIPISLILYNSNPRVLMQTVFSFCMCVCAMQIKHSLSI